MTDIVPEHVCIKCELSDPEGEMVALYGGGEHEFLAAWAHPQCLTEYWMSRCVEPHMEERKRKENAA